MNMNGAKNCVDLLKDKINRCGKVLGGNVLKVDGFLNHCVDIPLMAEIGRAFAKIFENEDINKIITLESSGIAPAAFSAMAMGVPMIFAKKGVASNMSEGAYSSRAMSYTHGGMYDIFISREYLCGSDRALIVDDFLANGSALRGLIGICDQAGARVAGCGIVIEKKFQGGGDSLRSEGYRIESLAQILSMDEHSIVYAN